MPIEGLPDPDQHRVCMRCTQWFKPEEGSAAIHQSFGLAGGIADRIKASAGDSRVGFICNRCAAIRRTRRLVLYAILGLALLWGALKERGLI